MLSPVLASLVIAYLLDGLVDKLGLLGCVLRHCPLATLMQAVHEAWPRQLEAQTA